MPKTVVRMEFGSHLYGTNTPSSDLDFKAVHVPDGIDILMQRASGKVSDIRLKQEGEKNLPGELDEESFSLARFLQLLAQGQTVAIDMIFAPDSALLESSSLWDELRANRHHFLTKKSGAFVGYCRQQANKYGIKGSRVAAAKAAMEFFAIGMESLGSTAKVFELEGLLINLIGGEHHEHTAVMELEVNKAGDKEWFFECCNRKVGFKSTIKEAHAIFSRIYENYGARAKLAETNEGVDWKALSHAVRVGEEALELLSVSKVTLPLRNAGYILDIKKGKVPYKDVARDIELLLDLVERASAISTLTDEPDWDYINSIVEREHIDAVMHYVTMKEHRS